MDGHIVHIVHIVHSTLGRRLNEPGKMTTKPANVQPRRETDPSFATSLSIIMLLVYFSRWVLTGRGRREKVIPDGSGERWLLFRLDARMIWSDRIVSNGWEHWDGMYLYWPQIELCIINLKRISNGKLMFCIVGRMAWSGRAIETHENGWFINLWGRSIIAGSWEIEKYP